MRTHRRLGVEQLESRQLCASLPFTLPASVPASVRTAVESVWARVDAAANSANTIRAIAAEQTSALQTIAAERADLIRTFANSIDYNPNTPSRLDVRAVVDAIRFSTEQVQAINSATRANILQATLGDPNALSAQKAAVASALSAVNAKFSAVESQLSSTANTILAGTWSGTWKHPLFSQPLNLSLNISVSQTGVITASGSGQHPYFIGNQGDISTFTFSNQVLTFNNSTRTLSGTISGTIAVNNSTVTIPFEWTLLPDRTTLFQAGGQSGPSTLIKQS